MTDEPSETPAINFVDHIAEADARVIAEAEKILDVSGTAIFRARLGKVVGDTHHPFPPPAERVVAALPPMLRDVDNARLPVSYQNATAALQQCCLVDECWEWQSRAEALSSYARQTKDLQLLAMAPRIRLRAFRRCGELLKEIAPAQGARTDLQLRDGSVPKLTANRRRPKPVCRSASAGRPCALPTSRRPSLKPRSRARRRRPSPCSLGGRGASNTPRRQPPRRRRPRSWTLWRIARVRSRGSNWWPRGSSARRSREGGMVC